MAVQAVDLVAGLQAELDTMREQLEWSNRLSQLGMLTAALAHETNNLLTPIRSYAQLALAKPGHGELTDRALEAAMVGTEKAGRLFERVLELASPSKAYRGGTCEVDSVVEDALACMLPSLRQHRIDAVSRVEAHRVGIDGLALEQVLINLISNASQAMSQTRGRRDLLIESSLSNGCLMLIVSDTGPGIPESIRASLFEPFVTAAHGPEPNANDMKKQNKAAETAKRKGSGLGLSICKQIIESARGDIRLGESAVGTRFEITLRTLDDA